MCTATAQQLLGEPARRPGTVTWLAGRHNSRRNTQNSTGPPRQPARSRGPRKRTGSGQLLHIHLCRSQNSSHGCCRHPAGQATMNESAPGNIPCAVNANQVWCNTTTTSQQQHNSCMASAQHQEQVQHVASTPSCPVPRAHAGASGEAARLCCHHLAASFIVTGISKRGQVCIQPMIRHPWSAGQHGCRCGPQVPRLQWWLQRCFAAWPVQASICSRLQ